MNNISSIITLFFHLLKGGGKLVGARCWLGAATYAFEACYHVVDRHILNQAADALQVAVAAAVKFHVLHFAVLGFNFKRLTASALSHISCLHCNMNNFVIRKTWSAKAFSTPGRPIDYLRTFT